MTNSNKHNNNHLTIKRALGFRVGSFFFLFFTCKSCHSCNTFILAPESKKWLALGVRPSARTSQQPQSRHAMMLSSSMACTCHSHRQHLAHCPVLAVKLHFTVPLAEALCYGKPNTLLNKHSHVQCQCYQSYMPAV